MNITLEDSSVLELPEEVVVAAGLRRGDDLGAELRLALEARGQGWKCKEAALNLLSHRPRAEVELRRRLRAKGFSDPIVESCLADLNRSGLIDDQGFADMAARDRLRSRPMGRRMLESELRAKGVDERTAAGAADGAIEGSGGDEVDLAMQALGKFRDRPREDALARKRRMYAFLGRRGFDPDTIRRAMERLGDDPEDGEPSEP